MAKKTIKQVVEGGGLKTFMDPRLIKALGHPLREHILAVLNERIASATEIGRELDLRVEDIYHHFRVLERTGCIELVETRQRRGGHEHFFQATTCLLIDDNDWDRVPATVRSDLNMNSVRLIFERPRDSALESGSATGSIAGRHVPTQHPASARLGDR
jgi:predicted transcriptional regulator